MSEEDISGEELAESLVPAIEQQLESPETPFVMEHYKRLVDEGEDPYEAKMMIALCLADEVEKLQLEGRDFNLERYKNMLQFLPALPE